MPTPFTHLEIAQRLLRDDAVPADIRAMLWSERGAFLLGNIAADARVGSGAPRDSTHFYQYRKGISEHPWRLMVQQDPALMTPANAAHRAFTAGYVAHLSVDEIWSLQMVGPHFARREWGNGLHSRFYMLHILLIYMDERDFPRIEPWQAGRLIHAVPNHWLSFLPDDDLHHWQAFIHEQIKPNGTSQTLTVLGERIGKRPEELQAFIDSPQQMQDQLWDNIPQSLLAEVEGGMYIHAREQMVTYMKETTHVRD
jgi:hypothetical protein